MDVIELLKKVRKIEMKSKKISNTLFAGEYHSAFKGRGVEFSEVREYQYGDDIRLIDWNVSSRMEQTYVKVNHEERELTIYLILDMSSSMSFGTQALKRDWLAELAAIFAFSAISNQDKVGCILFTDKVVTYVPPDKARKQVFTIIREILNFDATGATHTNLREALLFLHHIQKRKAIAVVLSDFYASHFSDMMKVVAKKHQIIPVWIQDSFEKDMPFRQMIPFEALEGLSRPVVWGRGRQWRKDYVAKASDRQTAVERLFRECRIRPLILDMDTPYLPKLLRYFAK